MHIPINRGLDSELYNNSLKTMSRTPMMKTSTKLLALKLQTLFELNQFGQ